MNSKTTTKVELTATELAMIKILLLTEIVSQESTEHPVALERKNHFINELKALLKKLEGDQS